MKFVAMSGNQLRVTLSLYTLYIAMRPEPTLYNVATLTASCLDLGTGQCHWADQYEKPGIVPVSTERFMTRLGWWLVVVTDGDSRGLRFHVDTMKQKLSPRGQRELFDSNYPNINWSLGCAA